MARFLEALLGYEDMATIAFEDCTITTYGADLLKGQRWRVRSETRWADFYLPRETPIDRLHEAAIKALASKPT